MRLDAWPGDPSIGHVVVSDQEHVPRRRDLDRVVVEAHARGFSTLRTSALFPGAREAVERYGFDTIDTLVLLRLDLGRELDGASPVAPPPVASTSTRSEVTANQRVRRLPRWLDERAAAVDAASFGPGWGNDARGIRGIRDATPRHRARYVRVDGAVAGFAIGGVGGTTGYLQRLAVAPEHRRRGIADALVTDLLGWYRSAAVDQVLVNTGTDNLAALALYDRHGFERLDHPLVVAELRLGGEPTDAGDPT